MLDMRSLTLSEITERMGQTQPGSVDHLQMASELLRRQTEEMLANSRHTLVMVTIATIALALTAFGVYLR